MKIVIIGDGKVGEKLASHLIQEDYDIVLIDNNARALQETIDKLDLNSVTGNGCDVEVQRDAGVDDAELVIACTSTDEINMLSCLIAKRLGAKHTIARVRNPIYYGQIDFLKEDLRLSMIVNPERMVASEISRLLIFPSAIKTEIFAKGQVELVEFPLHAESRLVGQTLSGLDRISPFRVLVCVVKHDKDIFIPGGDYVLREGDRLYIAGSHYDLELFFKIHGYYKEKIKKVMICGGGRVSYYLAEELLKMKMQVKIIEINPEICEQLSQDFPEATIINGDANDQDLLLEEDIKQADAFVALTGMDEENIVMSLFAKSEQVPKIIVKVNEDRRAKMVESFGVDSVVSAKEATADAIIRYVRAFRNSHASANVETLYQLVDEQVEALEFIVNAKSTYTDTPLKNLKIKKSNIIASIARQRKTFIPGGEDEIQVGDSVIVISMQHHVEDLLDIMDH